MIGVPLPLPVFRPGLDTREEGVSERIDSTLRFFAGGTFFVTVAVPFFLGRGRFFGTVDSARASSVEGIGTDDSLSGDWCLVLFSRLSELRVFELDGAMSLSCTDGRLASTGEVACGVARGSCLMCAGDRSPLSSFMAFEGSEIDGIGACDPEGSLSMFGLPSLSVCASEPPDSCVAGLEPGESCSLATDGRLILSCVGDVTCCIGGNVKAASPATSEAFLCSGERDATWYWSRVGELIFLCASAGGGGSSSMCEMCELLGRLSMDSRLTWRSP